MIRTTLLLTGGVMLAAGAAQAQFVPRGHLPPPGLCRVWYPDRPPGLQPAPVNCRAAERIANRYGGRVIHGGMGGPIDDDLRDDRRFMRWALRNYDSNRDGVLSRWEYRRALRAWR